MFICGFLKKSNPSNTRFQSVDGPTNPEFPVKLKQNKTVHFQWRISVTAIRYLLKKTQMRLVERNKCTIINQKLPWPLPHMAYLHAHRVDLTCRPWVRQQACCSGAGEVPRALVWQCSSSCECQHHPWATRQGEGLLGVYHSSSGITWAHSVTPASTCTCWLCGFG